jgi:glutamyl-Q tRNA(Asp) synthetase
MILAVSTDQNLSSPAYGYRGRFAPSPTGPLHAGSLVAALASWLDARKNQGKWLLRIEDVDKPRCIKGVDQEIMAQLLACGLQWDEEVVWQSARQTRYEEALERLNEVGQVYPCACSRLTIAKALTALGRPPDRHQELTYPGTCRPQQISPYKLWEFEHMQSAWRLALTKDLQIEFNDLALGSQSQCLSSEIGDFVLRRSDGLFTYQLAVVVDDADQGITHIVRGEDLLSNTARQIYLHKLLGFQIPEYLHLPLVLDEDGEKLSKQTKAAKINTQDASQSLAALRQAAQHLGLYELPDGETISIADWLLAATQAWAAKPLSLLKAT